MLSCQQDLIPYSDILENSNSTRFLNFFQTHQSLNRPYPVQALFSFFRRKTYRKSLVLDNWRFCYYLVVLLCKYNKFFFSKKFFDTKLYKIDFSTSSVLAKRSKTLSLTGFQRSVKEDFFGYFRGFSSFSFSFSRSIDRQNFI